MLMLRSRLRIILVIALLCLLHVQELRAAVGCESLASTRLPDTTITVAQPITAGSFTPPGRSDAITGLPPFCLVAGEIRSTTDSHIRFELFLPLKNWNYKFVGFGNIGIA